MYRLLIVDNEEIIVNHLYEIFRGIDHLDLDVYKAYSGEEAMEWLNRTRIDIVLTDIDMPEMDGLQLMEAIFQRWPQCKVIFLTGHSEFNYVYKAIQRQDVSYILKTEDIDKVIEVMEETVSKIRKEIKTEDMIRQAKEQIHMALDLFREDYLRCLLNGSSSVKAAREQFEQLSIPLQADWPVFLVLGRADKPSDSGDYMKHIQQHNSIGQIIRKYLAIHVNMAVMLDERHRFVIFVQPKEFLSETAPLEQDFVDRHCSATLSFLEGILEVIQSSCQDNIGIPVSFTVGSRACRWEEISDRYQSLSHLLNYKIGYESTILLADSEMGNKIRNDAVGKIETGESRETVMLKEAMKPRNMSVIEQYLESGQRNKHAEALEQVLVSLSGISSKYNVFALEAYHTLSLHLLTYINRWELHDEAARRISLIQLMRPDLFETWEEAAKYVKELASVLFDMQTLEQKKRADNTIDYLQTFIGEHLDEDLSLVRLAEQVHLNPSYLSRIYKQETGRNLTEFIDSARLAKAHDLLKNEDLRINDVARRVGYETATSFTRFFKKATGFSPQEFREKYTRGLI